MTLRISNDDIHVGNSAGQARNNALTEVLGTLNESRRLLAGITLFVFLIGVCHYYIATPIYQADAMVKVDQRPGGLSELDSFSDLSPFYEGSPVDTEAAVFQSRSVLGKVVDRLGLSIFAQPVYFPLVGEAIARRSAPEEGLADPWFNLPFAQPAWARDHLLDVKSYAWGGEHIEVERLKVSEELLGKSLKLVAGEHGTYRLFSSGDHLLLKGRVGALATANDGSSVLLISALRARPGTNFELTKFSRLDAINLLKWYLTVVSLTDPTTTRDEEQPGLIQVSLQGPDRKLVTATVAGIVDAYLNRNRRLKSSSAEKALRLLKKQMAATKTRVEAADDALSNYRLQKGAADLSLETQAILQQMTGVESQLAEAKRARTDALRKFTPRHYRVIMLDRQIGSMKQDLAALDGRIHALPETQRKIVSLRREVDANTRLYTTLRSKVQELQVVRAGGVDNAQVIENAAAPTIPVRPKRLLMLSLYFVLGVSLGTGAAFIRKNLRGVVEDPDVIEKELGLPVYAIVPHSKKAEKRVSFRGRNQPRRKALTAVAPQDLTTESLRSLRTSLRFASLGAKNNVLLVTGPGPGDGKSFVTLNLSIILAQSGKRVALIDADMRKGCLHEYFRGRRGCGLSDVVSGEATVEQALSVTAFENLSFLSTGTLPPNPSELLLHDRFSACLSDISSKFDHVIIDSPPALAVTDAAIIGGLAGATMLVVKASAHPLREIEHAVARLRQGDANVRGVVFNDLAMRNRFGYGKYYGYANAYAYS